MGQRKAPPVGQSQPNRQPGPNEQDIYETAWTHELKLFSIFFVRIASGMFPATGRGVAVTDWTDTFVKIGIMVFAIASLALAMPSGGLRGWSLCSRSSGCGRSNPRRC